MKPKVPADQYQATANIKHQSKGGDRNGLRNRLVSWCALREGDSIQKYMITMVLWRDWRADTLGGRQQGMITNAYHWFSNRLVCRLTLRGDDNRGLVTNWWYQWFCERIGVQTHPQGQGMITYLVRAGPSKMWMQVPKVESRQPLQIRTWKLESLTVAQ